MGKLRKAKELEGRRGGPSAKTLENMRSLGGGPPFIRIGRSVYYDEDEYDAWLANLPRYRSTSEADGGNQASDTPTDANGGPSHA